MRTLIVRGALITFFAVTGLFGSAATVEFDGMSASVQTNTAEANGRGGNRLCNWKLIQLNVCEPVIWDGEILP